MGTLEIFLCGILHSSEIDRLLKSMLTRCNSPLIHAYDECKILKPYLSVMKTAVDQCQMLTFPQVTHPNKVSALLAQYVLCASMARDT